MRIDRIWLRNYRQYREEKIDFPKMNRGRNFVVVQGTTGAGKTNLLNAINWCLYGDEPYLGRTSSDFPLVNTQALGKADPGDKLEVVVEIQFKNEDDRIVVTRKLGFEKLQDGSARRMSSYGSGTSEGEVRILRRKKPKGMVGAGELAIETTMPKALRDYFFFDGEQLNDYFREESPTNIREAIFRTSHQQKLENLIGHLESVKSKFQRKSRKLSPKAERIQGDIDLRRESVEKEKERLRTLKDQRNRAGEEEEKYGEKLRGVEVSNVSELQQERERLEGEIKEHGKSKSEIEEEKLDFLIDGYPLLLLSDAASETRELLREKEEAGEIPPDYKKNYIEKLLERGKCICRTDISEEAVDSEPRKNVMEVYENADEITDISEELSELNASLRNIWRADRSFQERLEGFNNKLDELKNNIEKKSERVKTIGSKLAGIDVEKVREWERERKKWKKKKEDKIEEIGRKEKGIEQDEKRIGKLEEKLEDELEKKKEGEELRKKLIFCRQALEVANNTKEKIMKDIREEVEEKTSQHFQNLIWKERSFEMVRIGEDYQFSALDQSGRDATGILSAGERQALALSFTGALNSVSGFDPPIVIDTPLGRIDKGEPRRLIALNLPNYLKDKQVTMLVTGSEYSKEVREALSSSVAKEYRIEFKELDHGPVAEVKPK